MSAWVIQNSLNGSGPVQVLLWVLTLKSSQAIPLSDIPKTQGPMCWLRLDLLHEMLLDRLKGAAHLLEGLSLQKMDDYWHMLLLPFLVLSSSISSYQNHPQAVGWCWRRDWPSTCKGQCSHPLLTMCAQLSTPKSLWATVWEIGYWNSLPWHWRGIGDERKLVITVENSFSTPSLWV